MIGGECSAGESALRHLLIRGVNKFNVSFAVPCLESLQRSMTVDLASYHKKYYGELSQAGADRVEVRKEKSFFDVFQDKRSAVFVPFHCL